MSSDTLSPAQTAAPADRAELCKHHVTRARRDSLVTTLYAYSVQNRTVSEFFASLESQPDISDREKAFRKAKQAALRAVGNGRTLTAKNFGKFKDGVAIAENAVIKQMCPGLAGAGASA